MAITWDGFDEDYHAAFLKVWQACFLTTGSVKYADDHCFRAFLVLGASVCSSPGQKSREADMILLHAVGELARKYYGKKPRCRATKRFMQKHPLAVPVSDEVIDFLRLPLNKRIVSIAAFWGLQGDEIKKASGLKALTPKIAAMPDLSAIQPAADLQQNMNAQIYLRFSQRNVAVENRIHRAMRSFDRATPYLALLVLAIFAFAFFFSESIK